MTIYNSRQRSEMVATERVALVVYEICVNGRKMTTAEIARRTGITPRGALSMMHRTSRIVPIYQDGDSRWRRS